ncbi:MAG: endo-1,4-beta-xylanase [Woeseiaceae bacterium]
MVKRKILMTVLLVLSFGAGKAADDVSLRAEFADHFLIGNALNVDQIKIMSGDDDFEAFVLKHFNALTAENAMKWERIHPAAGEWNWEPADQLVEFAHRHGIHLTGHTLVWHQQTPDWVFEDAEGNPASRELLLERMKAHIDAVVGRYKGRVPSWDVVNEGIEEDGSMRDTPWRQIIGDDYIEKAFEYAHAADPDAILFYNDYNMFAPGRRDGVIALVERLRAKGIPIHGIGLQGHMRVDYPETLDGFEEAIEAYGELGVDVAITELDVSVLPWPGEKAGGADITDRHEFDAMMNPYVDGLTPEAQAAFDRRYLEIFRILLENSDVVTRVTFWGINDGMSWRNGWPMEGRTDYPLLIDRDNQLKPVWQDIIAVKDAL